MCVASVYVHAHVYVCLHVCMCVYACMHTCVHAYICMCTCMCICMLMYVFAHVCAYACICVHTHMYECVYMCMYMHAHVVCVFVYICMYVHVSVCVCVKRTLSLLLFPTKLSDKQASPPSAAPVSEYPAPNSEVPGTQPRPAFICLLGTQVLMHAQQVIFPTSPSPQTFSYCRALCL